jgi:hypothetical protein
VRSLFIAARLGLVLLALAGTSGCLVVTLHPAYEDDWLAWDPALLGAWRDEDDKSSLTIEAAEWRSYRLHYEHPSEKGDLTGLLTIVGDRRYLDVMPARGEDRGSFVLPLHAVFRVEITEDHLSLTPLSYDWFADRIRASRPLGGELTAVLDEKQNALIVSPTARVRSWLRAQPADGPAWGAPATFTRVK